MTGQPAAEGVPVDATAAPEPLVVLWVGDPTLAERYVARRAPHIRIKGCAGNDVATALHSESGSQLSADLLVVDATLPGVDPLQILDVAASYGLDLPVVLLTPPSGKEELILQVNRRAVCDCIVKTEEFVYQILPAFTQVRARHDLRGVFQAARQSEEHVRHILETQPAVVFVMDPETRVAAMNRAGLALLSEGGDTVVGRTFTSFVPPEEQPALAGLVARVCAGGTGELEHSLALTTGEVRRVRTHAVSLTRSDGTVALATLHVASRAAEPDSILTAEIERLTNALAIATADLDAIRSEGAVSESRWAAAARASDEAHRFAIAEHEAERDNLRRLLDVATSKCAELASDRSQANESLESRIRELEAELTRLAESLQHVERDRDALADRERALKDGLAERERTLNDALCEAEVRQARDGSSIRDLEAARASLAAELSEARAQVAALGADCARLTKALAEAEAHRQAAQAEPQPEPEATAGRRRLWPFPAEVETRPVMSRAEPPSDELAAALARCTHLVEQLAGARAALRDAEARADVLSAELDKARHRAETFLANSESTIQDDRRDLVELRDMLIEVLCDADQRCKALLDRRGMTSTELEDARRLPGTSFASASRLRPVSTSHK